MIKVWSGFVRLSHWLLVMAFFTAFYVRNSEWDRDIHVDAGYAAGIILLLRIMWGFIGGEYEKFSAFRFDLNNGVQYALHLMKGKAKRYIGHNPAGSLVIYAMIATGLLTTISGILVYNDGYLPFNSSPLQTLHEWPAWIWLAIVAAHVLGVVTESLLHRDNLIMAMITGKKKSEIDSVTDSKH